MKTEHQFQEQKSQWNENEAWYASEDQATNFSEEQKHHQNVNEASAANLAEEQKHHWDASKDQATNLAEEQALQENKSDQETIFIDW